MKKGFTLVELMVVMTIMMVLTAIGALSYSQAVIKSRDGRRMSDLSKIQNALELYRHETGGPYPASDVVASTLVPKYLESMPTDPKTKDVYPYSLGATSYRYSLFAAVENLGSTTPVMSQTISCGSITCNYEVKSQ